MKVSLENFQRTFIKQMVEEKKKKMQNQRITNSNENKRVSILGDSMIKNVKGWKMSRNLYNAKVFVRDFSSAKVKCVKD